MFTCEPAALPACFSIFVKTCQNDGSNNAQGKRGQYIYVGVRQTNLKKSSHSPVE
jgi:hypothetical protein